jgi:hypothetical protein
MHRLIIPVLPVLLSLIGLSKPGDPTRADILGHAQQRFRLGTDNLRNVAEARQRFAEAAADLERIVTRENSPAFFLALGNAEALAGRWPWAIWAFECGRRLDPNDAALREHLDYARSLVNYPPGGRGRPVPDVWPGWLYRPTVNELLAVALIANGVGWLLVGVWYIRRRGPAFAIAAGLLGTAIVAGGWWYVEHERAAYDREHSLVVVAADGTMLHRGNGPSYPLHAEVPNLPAGLEARLLHQRGGWMQIQLTTGETGWVRQAKLLVVPFSGGS